ncbi:MAG: hypothetical protein HY939_07470 [Gammaproteobacteria bacterium]|nr:hypothetical protein [Gammaproteobacteria bacterium]
MPTRSVTKKRSLDETMSSAKRRELLATSRILKCHRLQSNGYSESLAQCLLTHFQDDLIDDILVFHRQLILKFNHQQIADLSTSREGKLVMRGYIEFLKIFKKLLYNESLLDRLCVLDYGVNFSPIKFECFHHALMINGFNHEQITDLFTHCLIKEKNNHQLQEWIRVILSFPGRIFVEKISFLLAEEDGFHKLQHFSNRYTVIHKLGYTDKMANRLLTMLSEEGFEILIRLHPYLRQNVSHARITGLSLCVGGERKIKSLDAFLVLIKECHYPEEYIGTLLLFEYNTGMLLNEFVGLNAALEENGFDYSERMACFKYYLSLGKGIFRFKKMIEQLPVLLCFLLPCEIKNIFINDNNELRQFQILIACYAELKGRGFTDLEAREIITRDEREVVEVMRVVLDWHQELLGKFDIEQLGEWCTTRDGREKIKNTVKFIEKLTELQYTFEQKKQFISFNKMDESLPDDFWKTHFVLITHGFKHEHLVDCFMIFETMAEKMKCFQLLETCVKALPDFVEPIFIMNLLKTEEGLQKLEHLTVHYQNMKCRGYRDMQIKSLLTVLSEETIENIIRWHDNFIKIFYFGQLSDLAVRAEGMKILKNLINLFENGFGCQEIVSYFGSPFSIERNKNQLATLAEGISVLSPFFIPMKIINILKTGEGLKKLQFLMSYARDENKVKLFPQLIQNIEEIALSSNESAQFIEKITDSFRSALYADLSSTLSVVQAPPSPGSTTPAEFDSDGETTSRSEQPSLRVGEQYRLFRRTTTSSSTPERSPLLGEAFEEVLQGCFPS